ncbi:MAG: hypothetical protein R3B49_09145 [Phycisphaerales bacterium]
MPGTGKPHPEPAPPPDAALAPRVTRPDAGPAIVRVVAGVGVHPLRVQASALSAEERARGERVAARIYGDLARLVAALPEPAQGASGMARHLDIVRNTCQRVVAALQDAEPTLDTLVKLPGVKGLDQFLEALAEHGADKGDLSLAETAVRQFEALIDELAGSHAKLAARIQAVGGSDPESSLASERARAALYEAAVGVTGRSTETQISLYAFRAGADDPGTLHRALAHAMIGATVTPGGMPATLASGNTLAWIDDADARSSRLLDESAARGRTPQALLKPFTSHPLPTVTSRGTPGNLVQVIDPAQLDGPTTFDVATADRSTHPFTDPNTGKPALDEVWCLVNAPTRHLIFDVYLHADIERRFRPAADAVLWNPGLSVPGGDRWIASLPAQPRVELLGQGLSRAATRAYPRHAELTRFFFDQLGWGAGEFVGFRVEVRYPIWRVGYCLRLEHLGA